MQSLFKRSSYVYALKILSPSATRAADAFLGTCGVQARAYDISRCDSLSIEGNLLASP